METLNRTVHFRLNEDLDIREELKEKRLFIDYKGLCISLCYQGMCEDDMIAQIASAYQAHQKELPDVVISFICRILLLVSMKESYLQQIRIELISFLEAYPSMLDKQRALERNKRVVCAKLSKTQAEFIRSVRALQFNQTILDKYFLKCTQEEVLHIQSGLNNLS